MRSILLSTNPSFSFFYTKRKLVDTHIYFFGLKYTGNFSTPKKSFLFSFHLWWSPCCDGLLCCWKGKSYCNLWDACLDLSLLLTVPPNCANFDQTKKEVIQQKRKSWMCHHFSFWFTMKECKKIKRISKIGLPRFLLTLKKRAAGNPEKGKTWKLRNVELSWIQLCIET